MRITPAKNIVILRSVRQKTKSGLEAVETGKNAPEIGEVVDFGKGTPPIAIHKGDTIIYMKYMENKVFIPQIGEEFNFIEFKNIVANMGRQS